MNDQRTIEIFAVGFLSSLLSALLGRLFPELEVFAAATGGAFGGLLALFIMRYAFKRGICDDLMKSGNDQLLKSDFYLLLFMLGFLFLCVGVLFGYKTLGSEPGETAVSVYLPAVVGAFSITFLLFSGRAGLTVLSGLLAIWGIVAMGEASSIYHWVTMIYRAVGVTGGLVMIILVSIAASEEGNINPESTTA